MCRPGPSRWLSGTTVTRPCASCSKPTRGWLPTTNPTDRAPRGGAGHPAGGGLHRRADTVRRPSPEEPLGLASAVPAAEPASGGILRPGLPGGTPRPGRHRGRTRGARGVAGSHRPAHPGPDPRRTARAGRPVPGARRVGGGPGGTGPRCGASFRSAAVAASSGNTHRRRHRGAGPGAAEWRPRMPTASSGATPLRTAVPTRRTRRRR
jgi:hypothetical protein